jgi:small subunit ribosomal protein S4
VRDREAQPPAGQHGKLRKAKLAGYGLQLREKQKVKRIYGVLENQFRRYFEVGRPHARDHRRDAAPAAGAPARQRDLPPGAGHVARAGAAARAPRPLPDQRPKVDIPSYSLKAGDVVTVRGTSAQNATIQHAMEEVKGRGIPEWLTFDAGQLTGRVNALPTREQINLPVQEQLIVELYRSSFQLPAFSFQLQSLPRAES